MNSIKNITFKIKNIEQQTVWLAEMRTLKLERMWNYSVLFLSFFIFFLPFFSSIIFLGIVWVIESPDDQTYYRL